MIYLTGDTHGEIDISKLSSKNWELGKTLSKDDYLIILGDFGLVWSNYEDEEEEYWLDWLDKKPWTTLFVDGNHENHNRLDSFRIIEKFGGKVHQISASVFHLMRGEYYTIDGKTFWVMGGATSIDRVYRIENKTWWSRELPSEEELIHGEYTLRAHNYKVDYILTHCAPTGLLPSILPYYQSDPLTDYLNAVYKGVEFNKWFCGHYHCNKSANPHFHVLYDMIIPLVPAKDYMNTNDQKD